MQREEVAAMLRREWIDLFKQLICRFTSRPYRCDRRKHNVDILNASDYGLELIVLNSHQRFQDLQLFITLTVLRLYLTNEYWLYYNSDR